MLEYYTQIILPVLCATTPWLYNISLLASVLPDTIPVDVFTVGDIVELVEMIYHLYCLPPST